MNETAHLKITAESGGLTTATGRLDGLVRSGTKAEKATNGLAAGFGRLVAPIAAVVSVSAGLSKLTNVAREFDIINAQLVTATGSAEGAAEAFGVLEKFAATTPYDLRQSTDAFTRLVNLGLTPTEEALTSFGNTASAMGGDLIQFVEAVADASVGEFERLKTFGIKARNEGETVAFTFRGITTTVKNNAAEIEGYLQSLGENEFAGAMAERAKTLDGAISNLGDTWDGLFRSVSKAGAGQLIADSVRAATDVLDEFILRIDSGEIGARIEAFLGKFSAITEGIQIAFDGASEIVSMVPQEWFGYINQAIDFVIDALKFLPENVTSYVQLMAVNFGAFVDYAAEYGAAAVQVVVAGFQEMADKAKIYGEAIGAFLTFEDYDLEGRLQQVEKQYSDTYDGIYETATQNAENIINARNSVIDQIFAENKAARDSYKEQVDAAIELTKVEQKRRDAASANLGKFKVGGDGEETVSKDFTKLVDELKTEEEKIQESYMKRRQIILDNTEETSEARKNLLERLNADFAEQALGDFNTPDTYQEQLDTLQEYYEARKELILSNTALTEEERTALELELTRNRDEQLAAMEAARMEMMLSSASSGFGAMADVARQFAGEQSGIFKGLFAVSKAFAIAESIVSITQGIANAARLPFPANIPAMASVAGATAGLVSTIAGTNMKSAGAFDKGGMIPAGQVGLVGEFGPELIQGPANVTSREDTLDMIRKGTVNNNQSSVVNNYNLHFDREMGRKFTRPQSKRQREAEAFNVSQRASRSVA